MREGLIVQRAHRARGSSCKGLIESPSYGDLHAQAGLNQRAVVSGTQVQFKIGLRLKHLLADSRSHNNINSRREQLGYPLFGTVSKMRSLKMKFETSQWRSQNHVFKCTQNVNRVMLKVSGALWANNVTQIVQKESPRCSN